MNMKSMSMYSTQYLVGAPFAWITAAMWRGMESISLWHCSGVMRAQVALIVAFSSSALLGLAYRIFLFTIPHIHYCSNVWGQYVFLKVTDTFYSTRMHWIDQVTVKTFMLLPEISVVNKFCSFELFIHQRNLKLSFQCPKNIWQFD